MPRFIFGVLVAAALCFACQNPAPPATPTPAATPAPESSGDEDLSWLVTMEAEWDKHCYPFLPKFPILQPEHAEQVRELLAGLGVRDLDNFRDVARLPGSTEEMGKFDEIWVFRYVISDSSGEYVPAVSGIALDTDTCEATLIKAQ